MFFSSPLRSKLSRPNQKSATFPGPPLPPQSASCSLGTPAADTRPQAEAQSDALDQGPAHPLAHRSSGCRHVAAVRPRRPSPPSSRDISPLPDAVLRKPGLALRPPTITASPRLFPNSSCFGRHYRALAETFNPCPTSSLPTIASSVTFPSSSILCKLLLSGARL